MNTTSSLPATLLSPPLAPDGLPWVELKMGLVLYLPSPPSRETVAKVYAAYMQRFGGRMRGYKSTASGHFVQDWTQQAQHEFETVLLPKLYRQMDWGYVFSDGLPTGSWLFMFHGHRRASEPNKASFLRFDFDRDVDASVVLEWARQVVRLTPFVWGSGGFYLQTRTNLSHASEANDLAFGLAQRYWGIEAHSLDVTVKHALEGIKCVNWLTLVGDELASRHPDAVAKACAGAFWSEATPHGTLLQASPTPLVGDRHRLERLDGLVAMAKALAPLQVAEHGALGGTRWTDDNTMEYLRRFERA